MYCRKCGKQLEENIKYCPTCGEGVNTHENNYIEKLKDKKVIGLVTGLIVVSIILAIGVKGQDVNRSPLSVSKAMFEAVDAQNVNQVIKCCGLEHQGEAYNLTASYKKELSDMLKYGDETLERQFGENWSKKIKYELMEDGQVMAELDGQDIYLGVMEVEGKYYLDFEEIF